MVTDTIFGLTFSFISAAPSYLQYLPPRRFSRLFVAFIFLFHPQSDAGSPTLLATPPHSPPHPPPHLRWSSLPLFLFSFTAVTPVPNFIFSYAIAIAATALLFTAFFTAAGITTAAAAATTANTVNMPRKKKTSADFEQELEELLDFLGEAGVRQARIAVTEYDQLRRQKKRGVTPLTPLQEQRLNSFQNGLARADYLNGCKIELLQRKISAAQKKEANALANAVATAATATATATVKLIRRNASKASSQQSTPTRTANATRTNDIASFFRSNTSEASSQQASLAKRTTFDRPGGSSSNTSRSTVPSSLRPYDTNAQFRHMSHSEIHANEVALLRRLRELKITVTQIGGDGNCFFRAASHQLYGTEEFHLRYRQAVIEYMEKHRAQYAPFFAEQETFDAHIQRMGRSGESVEEYEIAALSAVTGREIHIYVPNYDMDFLTIRHESVTTLSGNPIRISRHNDSHYNSLSLPDSSVGSTLSSRPGSISSVPQRDTLSSSGNVSSSRSALQFSMSGLETNLDHQSDVMISGDNASTLHSGGASSVSSISSRSNQRLPTTSTATSITVRNTATRSNQQSDVESSSGNATIARPRSSSSVSTSEALRPNQQHIENSSSSSAQASDLAAFLGKMTFASINPCNSDSCTDDDCFSSKSAQKGSRSESPSSPVSSFVGKRSRTRSSSPPQDGSSISSLLPSRPSSPLSQPSPAPSPSRLPSKRPRRSLAVPSVDELSSMSITEYRQALLNFVEDHVSESMVWSHISRKVGQAGLCPSPDFEDYEKKDYHYRKVFLPYLRRLFGPNSKRNDVHLPDSFVDSDSSSVEGNASDGDSNYLSVASGISNPKLADDDRPISIRPIIDTDDAICSRCRLAFNVDEEGNLLEDLSASLKVDDPRLDDPYGWLHLSCWNCSHPSVTPIFQVRDTEYALRLFQTEMNRDSPLFDGWLELNCRQRFTVLHHVFLRNLGPKSVAQLSLSHVVSHLACRSCETCISPKYCSWEIVGCSEPALDTVSCSVDGCDGRLHHICQIKLQDAKNLEEEPFRCFDCHQGAQKLLNPNRTAQSGRRSRRSSSPTPPRGPVTRSRSLSQSRPRPRASSAQSNIQRSRSISTRRPSSLDSYVASRCCNCKRNQFDFNPESKYHLVFHQVGSQNIKRLVHKCQHVRQIKSESERRVYNLCTHCRDHLERKLTGFDSLWPGYFWHLFSGSHTSDFASSYHYHEVIPAEQIWQMVPSSMRKWWISSVHEISFLGVSPYAHCSVSSPAPMFIDRTVDLQRFESYLDSDNLKDLDRAFRDELVFNTNVLCPFGCSHYCYDAGFADWDVIIQRRFQKVNLPLFSTKYYNYYCMDQNYFRDPDDYDAILLAKGKPGWDIMPSILLTIHGPKVLTCNRHDGGDKYLRLYPPRSPGHNLSAKQTDQLSHCVIVPRIAKPTIARQYNTIHSMSRMHGGFSGLDTANISTHSKWDRTSILMYMHENSMLYGRNDLVSLLAQKVECGQITSVLANNLIASSRHAHPHGSLDKYRQGATFVPARDVVAVHLAQSYSDANADHITIITNRGESVTNRRSWARTINIIQMEDISRYGFQFRAIPTMKYAKMMDWTMISIVSSVKELWHAINNKQGLFRCDGWEGNLLTYVQRELFPFHRHRANDFMFVQINKLSRIFSSFSSRVSDDSDDSSVALYQYSFPHMENLFPALEFPSIHTAPSIEELLSVDPSIISQKDILVVAGLGIPEQYGNGAHVTSDSIVLDDGTTFELRSMVFTLVKTSGPSPGSHKFRAIRYMRHGGEYSNWWKQERCDKIVTHCEPGLIGRLVQSSISQESHPFSAHCLVFVKLQPPSMDEWRFKIFESMGGKVHVRCACNDFPLIPTNAPKKSRKKCIQCHRLEAFVCSNINCCLRLCRVCYNTHPTHTVTTVSPPLSDVSGDPDDDDATSHSSCHDDDDDDSVVDREFDQQGNVVSGGDGNEHVDDDMFPDEDDPQNEDDLLMHVDIDESHDPVLSELNLDEEFLSTQAGDIHVDVEHMPRMEQVSGHVMYNMAAVCLNRRGTRITGTQAQRHFVQKLCSTLPGHSSPILYLEGMLHPRIFYFSAMWDSLSILGALPIWVYGVKKYTYGFAPLADMFASRIAALGSLTGTCTHYHRFLYDVMGNVMLSTGDSRQILNRGFQIDPGTNMGLSVRNQGSSSLSEVIDSVKMVRALGASQKYHHQTFFFTITANQSRTPGLQHITEHKRSEDWTSSLPEWSECFRRERQEIKMAMEEASAVPLLRNWLEVRRLFIKHLLEKCSFIKCVGRSIFARDEYQGNAGNLPHNHMVFEGNRSQMSEDDHRFFEELIRTSAVDLIRGEDYEEMKEKGWIVDENDAQVIRDSGRIYLGHVCGLRCEVRRDSNGKLRCRKRHPVYGSPNCACHQYVDMDVPLTPTCSEVLKRIDLEHHRFFHPRTHVAPCINNATDNMSPTIPELFFLFRSMVNTQSITHGYGLVKYLLKYISKFDVARRVMSYANEHTGATRVGSEFVHNTKAASSKYHEDKVFEKRRDRFHPQFREVPTLNMLQHLLLIPEIITNLNFVEISTLPFEVRSREKVRMDRDGNIRRRRAQIVDEEGDDEEGDSDQVDMRGPNADARESGMDAQRARENEGLELHARQRMTANQIVIALEHETSTRQYDMISIFGLRPPEVLSLFQNPQEYFRFCHIDENCHSRIDMIALLSKNLFFCPWFDCLGRRVYIRKSAVDEVEELARKNRVGAMVMEDPLGINEIVIDMIRLYKITDEDSLSDEEIRRKRFVKYHIIFDADSDLSPIPVLTHVNPSNTHEFFVHTVLSLGKYETEIDVLRNSSPRECFRKAMLIGLDNDEDSLRTYMDDLLRRFIVEEVVYYPSSIRKVDGFIVLANRVFEHIIVHDNFVANDIPFQLTEVLNRAEESFTNWWIETKSKQLDAIFNTLGNVRNIPSREDVETCDRYNPLTWNPVATMTRSIHQNRTSFREQRLAMELNKNSIDQYAAASFGTPSTAYTKNVVTHGSPGTGKSFIAMRSVLYSLSKGLRTLSSCLLGARANAIGGIHLHVLFCLQVQNKNATIYPYRMAELSLQKIMRKKLYHHALLTVDVLFLDELGQISAEMIAIVDIIFRKLHNSTMPFGGVLVLGTLDHAQLQPIKALPFLMSSLVTTSFTMVQLKESVRASTDRQFRQLQNIIRMNPYELIQDPVHRENFNRLMLLFRYVPDMNHPDIPTQMTRMYSRRRMVKSATSSYTESLIDRFLATGEHHYVRQAIDSHARSGGVAEYTPASRTSTASLTNQLREPELLVFFRWCLYECTVNDPSQHRHYNQSTLVLLIDMPDRTTLDQFGPIRVWVAPAGTQFVDFLSNGSSMPTKSRLRDLGWCEVSIGTAPEREIHAPNRYFAKRKQYALKHVGAMTINKSQGDTIPAGVAIEISSEQSCPWEKEQVVVAFSRTRTMADMIIVGRQNFVIDKIWQLITKPNQWTSMMENILQMVTINAAESTAIGIPSTLDFYRHFPFRLRDATLPSDRTGYVYLLVSYSNPDFTYIGETECLRQRFRQHQSGRGARGTSRIQDRPFAIAAYITGVNDPVLRRNIEEEWRYRRRSLPNHLDNPVEIVRLGQALVNARNDRNHVNASYVRISFVIMWNMDS